jgi:hypothetical protein
MKKLLLLYVKVMCSLALLLAAFPAAFIFGQLFFYEAFSWLQIAKQAGTQLAIVTLLFLGGVALVRLWAPRALD